VIVMTSLGSVRTWWRGLDRRLVDAAVVVVLLVVTALPLATRPLTAGQRPSDVWAYLLVAALCVPFAFHRRWPVTAVAVACCALILYALGKYSAYPGVPLFVLVAGVSLHSTRRRSLLAVGLAAVALSVAVFLQPEGVATTSTWVASLLALAVAWLWGENLRNRRARWAAMEERARRLEAEREECDRQAVIAERLRIARELHDVVAHSMSVIAVQSGVANHVIDARPAQARQALATIEATSRSALVELRRLLGVLRQGDDPVASLEPNPGMAELGRLAEQIRSAGVKVELKVEGEPGGRSPRARGPPSQRTCQPPASRTLITIAADRGRARRERGPRCCSHRGGYAVAGRPCGRWRAPGSISPARGAGPAGDAGRIRRGSDRSDRVLVARAGARDPGPHSPGLAASSAQADWRRDRLGA
jgi:signal transduction histidine kinase